MTFCEGGLTFCEGILTFCEGIFNILGREIWHSVKDFLCVHIFLTMIALMLQFVFCIESPQFSFPSPYDSPWGW